MNASFRKAAPVQWGGFTPGGGFTLTLRRKLTLWYGAVMALFLALFGISLYLFLRSGLAQRIDTGLHEELGEVVAEAERATDRADLLRRMDETFSQHEGFGYQVSDAAGGTLYVSPKLRAAPLPNAGPASGYRTLSETSGPRQRVIRHRIATPAGPLTLQVARPLDELDEELAQLLTALLTAGPLTLLAAMAGGYVLAARALRPVETMRVAAEAMTADRLDRRLTVTADDELGRLAGTLNGMIARLERSFHEMRRFTADASHELRTPIAVIRTEAEVALRRPVDTSVSPHLLGNILEECERLTLLTDQLLTLSREDAGIDAATRAPLDLAALATDAAETMRPLAEAKGQTLRLGERPRQRSAAASTRFFIHGDAQRLRRVIYNLLDNAIKYTPANGTVTLTISAPGNSVRLSVTDSGIGIAPEHLPHVFERFYRVDAARGREGGTGLGLSIVQSIVAAHGGTVSLESAAGQGTTFTLTFPVIHADGGAVRPDSAPSVPPETAAFDAFQKELQVR